MYDLLSAQEIRKRFRNALGRDVSLQAIHHVAQKIGYKEKHIGGKRGYHKSLYTALTQHFKDLVDYDTAKAAKTPQKAVKRPKEVTWNDGNYYAYNGERDNDDYGWEKNEGLIRRAILEAINKLNLTEI
jgi:hypothetical protein